MSINKLNEQPSLASRRKTPWHLFLVVFFFVLIYLVGLYDYVSIHINNLNYINSIPAKGNVAEYFSNYPGFFSFLWTIHVFGGLIAGALLLFRNKRAVWISLAVVISKLSLDLLTFLFRNRWEVFGPQISITDIKFSLITVGFFFYCKVMAKKGILI